MLENFGWWQNHKSSLDGFPLIWWDDSSKGLDCRNGSKAQTTTSSHGKFAILYHLQMILRYFKHETWPNFGSQRLVEYGFQYVSSIPIMTLVFVDSDFCCVNQHVWCSPPKRTSGRFSRSWWRWASSATEIAAPRLGIGWDVDVPKCSAWIMNTKRSWFWWWFSCHGMMLLCPFHQEDSPRGCSFHSLVGGLEHFLFFHILGMS